MPRTLAQADRHGIRHTGRWLPLLIVASALGCSAADPDPDAAAVEPSAGEATSAAPWFRDVAAESGLTFRHDPGVDGSFYLPEIMGAGGALFDYDGDGDLDVYFVNSGPHPPAAFGGPSARNRMFRREAHGSFVDVTDSSGLGDAGYGMGCAVGDVDNDGDADLFVSNLGPDALYRNEGGGRFVEITEAAGIGGDRWSTSAAFFDYDRDGWLDLYVVGYLTYSPPKACRDTTGRPDYCGPDNFFGIPDQLYRNNGDGTFREVTSEAGLAHTTGKGLGVFPADLNDDGWVDIYVANDGVENQLWINQKDSRFLDRALVLGAAVNIRGQPEASMGIAVGDVDRDGDLDLFMTHLDRETNTFYRNGGNWFEDVTAQVGLGADSLPLNGFGAEFFDYDQDGDLDLLALNGRVRLRRDAAMGAGLADPFLRDYAEPNLLFENDGIGSFRNRSDRAGGLTNAFEVSRGLAPGDVDGDGDLDLLVTNCNGPARLYLNEVQNPGHWLAVRTFLPELGRDAIGSRIRVVTAAGTQVAQVTRTGSYLTSRPPVVHFGLGGAERVVRILVRWPDGDEEEFPGTEADRVVRLVKGRGKASSEQEGSP